MANWQLNSALTYLLAQVNAMAPSRSKASDGTIGDTAHASRKSDHNPDAFGIVNAIDITHDPENGCNAALIAEALRKSHDCRIKYVIHAGRIFSSKVLPWTWRPYTGENAHAHHVHVSVYGAEQEWRLK